MKESSLQYTVESLGIFLSQYYGNSQGCFMRLGQAACFVFIDLPKKMQDDVFYCEDEKYVGQILWNGLFID